MSRGTIWLCLSAAVLAVVLMLPSAPLPISQIITRVPVELPIILAALCLAGRTARIVVTVALTILTVLKVADLAMRSALGRAFNPVADLSLIDASLRLISGSFGQLAAIGAAIAALVAIAAIAATIWWAAGVWSKRDWTARGRVLAISAAFVAALSIPLAQISPRNSTYAAARVDLAQRTITDLRELRQAATLDPFAGRADLLGAVDRDVLVIFIESYGRASFDVPFYADRHVQTLLRAQDQLEAAGLAMRSGFLTAPTKGGQSWLSHSTFANGLWISDQARYHALRASGRESLFHHARRSGFQTAAVMPAITRPWPEAAAMGFDRVLAADDLGYQGKPFNWVTMPDQFTLTAVDRLLHKDSVRVPFFMQIALISSHAPWVPVPSMLPWDQVGDGREFNAMAEAGDPPRVVWRDRERVKRQYRDSIDYALQASFGFAARQGKDAPLVFILGDHQAAPRIAMDPGRDVAMHVIGPAALVDRVAAWDFGPGLIPPEGSEAIPMDRLRDLILRSFDSAKAPA